MCPGFYTGEYTQFPGEVFYASPDKVADTGGSAEMCARACTIETSFRCESFELCQGPNPKCGLRKTHVLAAKPGQITNTTSSPQNCLLYSRMFHFFIQHRQNIRLLSMFSRRGHYVCYLFDCLFSYLFICPCTLMTPDHTIHLELYNFGIAFLML